MLLADIGAGGRDARIRARADSRWCVARRRFAELADDARPAAADRPARPAVALGDAAVDAAPVRCAVLRRGAAGRRGGDASRATRWRRTPGCARATRSTAMADGRLAMWLPTSTTLQQLEHASLDRGDPRAAGAGTARPDRGRRGRRPDVDPDRHARRRRCRRPAGLRLSRRSASVRARRSGRSDRARRSIGRWPWRRPAAAPSRRSP